MLLPGMSFREADVLLYFLEHLKQVQTAKVYEQTADAAVVYSGEREALIRALRQFRFENAAVPQEILENSGRGLNVRYRERLIKKTVYYLCRKWLLPYPARCLYIVCRSLLYFKRGFGCLLKRRIEVPVLDMTAIGVSMLRGEFGTAGSVMFLLGIGDILEEWTHKKSVEDLARSMSLNVGKVWLKQDGQEISVDASEIIPGDQVVVHMGSMIPFDGVVVEGEAMVSQASLTGEGLPVKKDMDGYVYAGTAVEEGELTIRVREVSGSTRYEKIITLIEESEKLKSAVESEAEHLADRLVPYTFLGTGLAWLFTRNVTRALSVLMVDFSCALKLAMPITVLSAIREANAFRITVKGGKYLEAMADASTIVFDKTGTLTKAQPTVKEILSFGENSTDEMLKVAACLEEHFPHSMAKAVVRAAKDRHLEHEEMHSRVDYIVAHGIASYIDEKRVVIGSSHFVFEDEGCNVREEYRERFEQLPVEYSHLYLAIEDKLEAVICIEDPVREEAGEVIQALKREGFGKVVMMTGDSERTAAAIASRIGVDEYYSEVLPEDKAEFVRREKREGNKVVMVGDGINDSPALSASDVGIAVSGGAAIAREIADITISADDLRELLTLRRLSKAMLRRIRQNYRVILGVNGCLILLGVGGVIQPTTSALLHNASTIGISLRSMNNLLE
nr:heavy metal translocating P-type ATPase [Lientehia hominis]